MACVDTRIITGTFSKGITCFVTSTPLKGSTCVSSCGNNFENVYLHALNNAKLTIVMLPFSSLRMASNKSKNKSLSGQKKGSVADEVELKEISKWASCQRSEFTRLKNGSGSKMTKRRMSKLEIINFEWYLAKAKRLTPLTPEELARIAAATPGNEADDLQWDTVFEKYWQGSIAPKIGLDERNNIQKQLDDLCSDTAHGCQDQHQNRSGTSKRTCKEPSLAERIVEHQKRNTTPRDGTKQILSCCKTRLQQKECRIETCSSTFVTK